MRGPKAAKAAREKGLLKFDNLADLISKVPGDDTSKHIEHEQQPTRHQALPPLQPRRKQYIENFSRLTTNQQQELIKSISSNSEQHEGRSHVPKVNR